VTLISGPWGGDWNLSGAAGSWSANFTFFGAAGAVSGLLTVPGLASTVSLSGSVSCAGALHLSGSTSTYSVSIDASLDTDGEYLSGSTTYTTSGGSTEGTLVGAPAPIVTGLNSDSGLDAGGDSVTVFGRNLAGATAVDFGTGNAASIGTDGNDELTVTTPQGSGAGTVDVTVTTIAGTSATTTGDQFAYTCNPTISGAWSGTWITPPDSDGNQEGGNLSGDLTFSSPAAPSTITGSGQLSGLAPTPYGGPIEGSATCAGGITIVYPDGSQTSTFTGTLTPTGNDASGTFSIGTLFPMTGTWSAGIPTPVVSQVSPAFGPTRGGTAVTVTGQNLNGATSVAFGGVAGTIITDGNDSLTAVSPMGSGTVDVTVTTPGGTSPTSATDQFTYLVAPTVSAVSPLGGSPGGGTVVTISGSALTDVTGASFGGTAGTIDSYTGSTATVTAPPGTGTVNVTVTTPGGTSGTSTADLFTYWSGTAPTVTKVSPARGPAAGGTKVKVDGTNLVKILAVSFGSVPATKYAADPKGTTLTVTAPPGVAGTVDVIVTTSGGPSPTTTADQFTYTGATVAKISPSSGPSGGGTTVTIHGTNLAGATAVYFGGTAAASFASKGKTALTAVSPAEVVGTVDITVVTPSGTTAIVPADVFRYT
jgi:hypothetical protein